MQITHTQISKLVGEPSLSHGQEYCETGAVQFISIADTLVKAKVIGSRSYRVQLMGDATKLDGKCSCPAFLDFGPCKHIAAAGLALIKHNQGTYSCSGLEPETEEYIEFMKSLRRKTKQELIDVIENIYEDYPDIIEYI